MFHVLCLLRDLGHEVTFVPDNLADIPPYGDALRKRGILFLHHPYVRSIREYLNAHGGMFDVVILSRCDFARKHIVHVREYAPQSRVIFDTVDLHFLREGRHAEMTNDPEVRRKAGEKQQVEYELIEQSDETWVVSPVERDLLRSSHPDVSIEVVSNIVEIPGSATPFSLRQDFLFIGSFQHTPNIDAVLFFTHKIYPLVQARLPTANFFVIGDKAPPAVVALASENIIITGFQPDVRPYFDSVKLSIAPLRWGAGVKGKVNQSMGFGVPVVATTVAVEGMALTNREDILIADDPETFARALIDLYESEDLWTRVSEKGIAKTAARFSREVAQTQLSRLLGDNHIHSSNPRRFDNENLVLDRQSEDGLHIGAAP
jgi:glycosyltransferase involved in cell wall biosynthesis